jgi:hypothetical protein
MLKSQVVFWCLLAFVAVVSLYDEFLSWKTERLTSGETIVFYTDLTGINRTIRSATNAGLAHYEENPVGRFLLHMGGIEMFLAAKAAGTIAVILAVFWLHRRRPAMAMTSACALAAFQFCLTLYLNFA